MPATSDAGAAESGAEVEAVDALDLTTLGQSCTGGCSPGKVCLLKDDSCSPGVCAVDGREGFRSYCSLDCSKADCPEGFECVPALNDQRVCVANGEARCGDHIVDKGEECDRGGTNPLECTDCKIAPATLRLSTLHAVRTNAPELKDPGVFETKAPLPRVKVPYARQSREGVYLADVKPTDSGIRVDLWMKLLNPDPTALHRDESEHFDFVFERKAGQYDAASLVPPPTDDSGRTCPVSGAFDVELSGQRTYLIKFDYTAKCSLDTTPWYELTVKGALEVIAPPESSL